MGFNGTNVPVKCTTSSHMVGWWGLCSNVRRNRIPHAALTPSPKGAIEQLGTAHIKSKEEMELERRLFPTHKLEHSQLPARRMKGMSLRETEYKAKNRPVSLLNMGHMLSPCAHKRMNECTMSLVDAIFPEH